MIKVIPFWKLAIEKNGMAGGIGFLISIPALFMIGVFMSIQGMRNGDVRQTTLVLLATTFVGFCFILFIPQKEYKPGISFSGYRNSQTRIEQGVKYAYAVIIFILIAFLALTPKNFPIIIGFGIAGLAGIYATKKSIKHHGDVDFAVNEQLAVALGFAIDEKVLVSYSNFGIDDLKPGSNAFAATATKLVLAVYDGKIWRKSSHSLDSIASIGIIPDQDQSHFIKLIFQDGLETKIRLDLNDKLTSNPYLVIRKLLETIDSSLGVSSSMPQGITRRRVVVRSEANAAPYAPTSSNVQASVSKPSNRSIDLSPVALDGIKNAAYLAGRNIEL